MKALKAFFFFFLIFISIQLSEMHGTLKGVKSMNKIFQGHVLDNLAFRLVAILKSVDKIFEKQLQINPFLR